MTSTAVPKGGAWRLRVGLSLGAALLAVGSLLGTLLGQPLLAALGPGLVPMSPIGSALVLLLAAAFSGEGWRRESSGLEKAGIAAATLVGGAALAFVISHASEGTLPFET
jgi:hypothetical protein